MYSLHALPARGGSASASASFTAEQANQIFVERRHIVHVEPYPLPLRPLNSRYIKPKQVTDPLNEAVRARLIGNCSDNALLRTVETPGAIANPDYSTSGSDHGIDSSILTDMRFLEEDEQEEECADSSKDNESDDETPGAQLFLEEQLRHILERVSSSTAKLEVMVLRDVRKALGMAERLNVGHSTEEERHSKSYLRRFVMKKLRSAGYNAGICKSRWEQTNGCPAGDYELVDVVATGEGCSPNSRTGECDEFRLLVDIDFRAQFEIARPTAEYACLVEQLPALFVGDAVKLRDIIRTMCDAAKLSLRAKGMHLPPWRKYRYVAAKWMGPYKRTTNALAVAVARIDERQLVLRELSGITSFKGMDAAFTHQLELHFEKAVREANRSAQNKLKSQRQPSSNDLFLSEAKSKSGLNAVRTSALATALAEVAAHMH